MQSDIERYDSLLNELRDSIARKPVPMAVAASLVKHEPVDFQAMAMGDQKQVQNITTTNNAI